MFLIEERVLEGKSAWMHRAEGERRRWLKANVIAGGLSKRGNYMVVVCVPSVRNMRTSRDHQDWS